MNCNIGARKSEKMLTICDLPCKMIVEIFSFIHVDERPCLALVCQQWASIIESMWHGITKLILTIGTTSNPYGKWEDVKTANIICRNISSAVKVLKKFNGNLTILDFSYSYESEISGVFNEVEWYELCEEIRKNKNLQSVKLRDMDFKDEPMCLHFLQCIPSEKLEHLSLNVIEYESTCDFEDIFTKLVRSSPVLKYLSVEKYLGYIMREIIHEIHTLESLHVTATNWGDYYDDQAPDILNFPNLTELTVSDGKTIDDNFLYNLGRYEKSLRALDLITSRKMTQEAFNSVGALKNLTLLYLSLHFMLDIDFICNLKNIEGLYIRFQRPYQIYRFKYPLEYILQQLPKLKECWFYRDEIHDDLKSKLTFDKFQLKSPENLDCVIWYRILGMSENRNFEAVEKIISYSEIVYGTT